MIDFFWLMFESLVTIFQAFIIVWFTTGFLESKYENPMRSLAFWITDLVLTAAILIANAFTVFEGPAILIYCIILFVYALLFLQGTILKKLFASIAPIAGIALVSSCVTTFTSALLQMPLADILNQKNLYRVVLVVLIQTLFFYILLLLRNISKKRNVDVGRQEWVLIALVLVVSILIFLFLNCIALYSNLSEQGTIWILLSDLGLIVINIITFFLIIKLGKAHTLNLENSLLKQQQIFQKQSVQGIKTQYEELRKIQHDFNQHLCVIQILNKEHKPDAIHKYISEYFDSREQTVNFIDTDNDFVNAIVNSKLEHAKELGIKISVTATKTLASINNIDLCNLIANLFDNAIEACQKCSGNKQIIAGILSESQNINIVIKNSIEASVLAVNPNLQTSKADHTTHGYGTKIIRNIVQKYHGFIDYYEEDGMFCCSVNLYTT